MKEKQIEEMAIMLKKRCDSIPMGECAKIDCQDCTATFLYNAGYRKQSEGEWIIKHDEMDNEYMMCSVCKEEFYPVYIETINETPNFCPNCGAKMKGGEG